MGANLAVVFPALRDMLACIQDTEVKEMILDDVSLLRLLCYAQHG